MATPIPVLREATPSQVEAVNRLSFAEWGKGLTVDQYLERERLLHDHPWSRAAKTSWVLVQEAVVLSSCETYDVAASIGARTGRILEIASVFTPSHLRKHGYASEMIHILVVHQLQQENADCLGISLYSDIGPDFYAKLGFTVYDCDPLDEVLEVAAVPGALPLSASTEEMHDPPSPSLLFPASAASVVAGKGGLVAVPCVDQLRWHAATSAYHASRAGKTPASAAAGGARTAHAAVSWCPDKAGEELLVLWVTPTASLRERADLMAAAQRHASQAGLQRVRVWAEGPGPRYGGAMEPRKGKLPMLLPLVQGVAAFVGVQRGLWV